MPTIQTGRLNTYYELHGDGEPVLLIRGLGSTCDGFKAQVDGLSPHFRVISFDNRCVGRTDQPQEPFTIADMADDTAALLDALGVESAHVFGVSLGGMVAQELVLRFGALEGFTVGNQPLRLPTPLGEGPYFLIDIDSFWQGNGPLAHFDEGEAIAIADRLHEPVSELFERCITDVLRDQVLRRPR